MTVVYKGTMTTIGRTILAEGPANSTFYYDNVNGSATETSAGNIIPFSGSLRNLWIDVFTNTLDAGSTVFTLVKNGTDTAVTVTVAFGVTSITGDTTHIASVTAGDRVTLKVVSTGTTGTAVFAFSYQVK